MSVAIGVVFLALFVGVFFLLALITAFYFWRRSKRRNVETNRQFSAARSQSVENYSIDDDNLDDNELAFADASDYAENSNNDSGSAFENREADASMRFESAAEGGGYGSDYSDSSSSSSYDSSSASDSSSSSDSGSSSSWD